MGVCAREALDGGAPEFGAAVRVIDAVVRALATWGKDGHVEELRGVAVLQLLVWCCSTSAVADNCAGNAALCVAYVADERCVPA